MWKVCRYDGMFIERVLVSDLCSFGLLRQKLVNFFWEKSLVLWAKQPLLQLLNPTIIAQNQMSMALF